MFSCFKYNDLHRAVALVIDHEDTRYIKRIIIRILRDYAKTTENTIDDTLVDEIEKRLLFPTPPL
jgi:hypothetical protein